MINKKEIIKVIKIINKEVKKFRNPIVTRIGQELNDPYKVLISCLISLRTKDDVTAKASKKLFAKADSPEKMIKLNENYIGKLILPANYYKTKAKNIKEISKILINEYNGRVPETREELMKLPGVGPKTSAIVMTYGYLKNNFIPVDVHCHRIPNRLGWIKTKTPEETEKSLMKIIPRKYWQMLNNNFVTFGQNICLPVSPYCSKCPVRKYCKRVNVKHSR